MSTTSRFLLALSIIGFLFFSATPVSQATTSCSGTYAFSYSDLTDVTCPVTTSVENLNIYGSLPVCPTNLTGQLCTGPCKVNTLSQNGCTVQTNVYSCIDSGGQAVSASCSLPISASVVTNPTQVVRGESALLTWSSTGATSCVGTNFDTGGATGGSVYVTPQVDTKYYVTCTNATAGGGGNYWTSTGYLANPPNKCVSETCPSTVGTSPDPVSCSTAGATCQRCDGAPVGHRDAVVNLYECKAGSAVASATVLVVVPLPPDPDGFSVSCRPHPTRAAVDEDVLWSSTVAGPAGTYTYSWSGTDGLSGTGNQVFKKYSTQGTKAATLTVTFTPGAQASSKWSLFSILTSWFTPTPAEAACTPVINNNQWYDGASVITANEGLNSPYDCAVAAVNAGYSYWNRSVRTTQCTGNNCVFDPVFTVCYGLNNPGNLISKPRTSLPSSGGGSALGEETVFDSGNVCTGSSGSQCPVGQTAVPTFNVMGSSCSGGTRIGKLTEGLDAVQISMWPGGWMAEQCMELGAQEGDCCEYSQKSSTSYGGGYPANSRYQFLVFRGGTFSNDEVTGGITGSCNIKNSLQYQCSSVAGSIGTRCISNGGGGKTKTVTCDNPVVVGAPECSDGIDNDGDGLSDRQDPGCSVGSGGTGGDGYDPDSNDETGSGLAGPAQCSDGIDNNRDGAIDYPEDPGCASATDNLERAEPADLSLKVNPPLIKKDQQCTITLSARNVVSCSLSGTGISNTYTAQNGFVSTQAVVTPGLSQTATYTFSCKGLDGISASKKVDCKIAPTFEEI